MNIVRPLVSVHGLQVRRAPHHVMPTSTYAVESPTAFSPSAKFHKLFDGESGVGDDPAERADLLVVGNDDSGVRPVAAEDHVAAGLAAEDEPGALKGGLQGPTDRSGAWPRG